MRRPDEKIAASAQPCEGLLDLVAWCRSHQVISANLSKHGEDIHLRRWRAHSTENNAGAVHNCFIQLEKITYRAPEGVFGAKLSVKYRVARLLLIHIVVRAIHMLKTARLLSKVRNLGSKCFCTIRHGLEVRSFESEPTLSHHEEIWTPPVWSLRHVEDDRAKIQFHNVIWCGWVDPEHLIGVWWRDLASLTHLG